MSANLPSRPSADVLNGIKIIILSGALAGTIATWGWISSNSMKTAKANDDPQPTDPPVENQFAIVIPTVMDVVTLDTTSIAAPVVETTPQPDIRAVEVLPTQAVNASGPEIKTVIVSVPVASGGGGGGGKSSGSSSSKPAAKTKSS